MDVFSFWFILALYSVKTFAQRCKLTQRSENGLVLLDNVYKSFTVDRLVSCYIACNSQPACQSLNFRLSDKTCQFNKETKFSCPTSLKQNEGFIYADNPNRGENILKTLGLFYQSATVKKFMVTFFIWFCLIVFKQTCVSRQIYFFLVTSTTEEIGRHNFKGLGNVINPLSHKVSRIRN